MIEEFKGEQCFHLISRKTAQEKGLKRFFTGKPCNHGHIAERYTSSKRCLTCHRIYEIENRESILARHLKRHYDNRDEILAQRKVQRDLPENKEKKKVQDRKWREKNREYDRETSRQFRLEHKEYLRGYHREYRKRVLLNDPNYRVITVIRSHHRRALLLCKKEKLGATLDALGYTVQEYRENLERNFLEGMTWDNYGDGWQIDHKIPVSRLIKDGVTDSCIINALDNLVPMWAYDNQSKNDMTMKEWLEQKGEDSREWKLYSRYL